jgi:multicomponent Na+:H+ antiporter subunit E
VRKKKPEFDVEHLTERGVPGPRGYRGTHGGRASEDGTFDIDKVDSTPHATAFVAAIMRQEDELDEADLPDLTREERERIAREHARKVGERRAAETKRKREARAAKAAQEAEEVDSSVYERAAEGLLTGPFGVVRRPDDDGDAAGSGEDTGTRAERPGTAAAAEAGRRHPGRHSTSAGIGPLVNAYELRSKFPQPPLYLSSRKNRKDPKDPRNRKKGKR